MELFLLFIEASPWEQGIKPEPCLLNLFSHTTIFAFALELASTWALNKTLV